MRAADASRANTAATVLQKYVRRWQAQRRVRFAAQPVCPRKTLSKATVLHRRLPAC